jgi:hypothetical protein
MIFTGITPIHQFGNYYVKREDLACWTSLEYPSGSKVRQYMNMAQGPGVMRGDPCIVGCSANSAMQIYVAAAARQLGVPGIIYVPERKVQTDATKYAIQMGAAVTWVRPGYASVVRKKARERAIQLKHVVQWDRNKAIGDTIKQCINIPENVKRIIVPTGSGLTATGILVGVCTRNPKPIVVAVGVSELAEKWYAKNKHHSNLELIPPPYEFRAYDKPMVGQLPDGTPLDPFYAVKAMWLIQEGDLLWPPGLRPVCSMPKACQEAFKDWKGPNETDNRTMVQAAIGT